MVDGLPLGNGILEAPGAGGTPPAERNRIYHKGGGEMSIEHNHLQDSIYRGKGSGDPYQRCILEHAAPDLLEACKVARNMISVACGEEAPFIKIGLTQIDAAISKAESL